MKRIIIFLIITVLSIKALIPNKSPEDTPENSVNENQAHTDGPGVTILLAT